MSRLKWLCLGGVFACAFGTMFNLQGASNQYFFTGMSLIVLLYADLVLELIDKKLKSYELDEGN